MLLTDDKEESSFDERKSLECIHAVIGQICDSEENLVRNFSKRKDSIMIFYRKRNLNIDFNVLLNYMAMLNDEELKSH